MDMNEGRYFYLSGLISISLFVTLLFFVGYSVFLSPKIEQFAMIKSDVINVSIAISDTKKSEETLPEPISKPVEPVQSQNEEPTAEPEKVPEISDLFSDIKIQKPLQEDTKRKEQLNKLENEILTRKDTPRFSDKVSKVELAKPSVKMVVQGGSTGPIVNEYHAKIQGLVYTYFHPPSGTAGEVARVRMSISASGKLTGYKVVRYSGNTSFNGEVDWLKDRLSTIRFPEHPEGKDTVLEFILTAKE
jgi:hypothetical protein